MLSGKDMIFNYLIKGNDKDSIESMFEALNDISPGKILLKGCDLYSQMDYVMYLKLLNRNPKVSIANLFNLNYFVPEHRDLFLKLVTEFSSSNRSSTLGNKTNSPKL